MDDQSLAPWLTLSLQPGMSSRLFNALLERFGSPSSILNAGPPVPYAACSEIPRAGDGEIREGVARALRWRASPGRFIVTLADASYPALLREIADPPPVLYIKGDPGLLSLPQIAMVGSRKPTPGGRKAARRLAGDLAAGGIAICSGLALGIDYESHSGALEAGGSTIAVLGCGVDVVYPKRNAKLAGVLEKQGAVVSEFPLGTPPLRICFPQRNRIISGLSLGTAVVEAALRSGSLITAQHALEQGREVFAVPGSIHNPLARGCHELLKNGAKLVQTAADVVEELGYGMVCKGPDPGDENAAVPDPRKQSLSAGARKLLEAIDHEVTSLDSLVHRSGLSTAQVHVLLTELELSGLIQARPGGYALAVL